MLFQVYHYQLKKVVCSVAVYCYNHVIVFSVMCVIGYSSSISCYQSSNL